MSGNFFFLTFDLSIKIVILHALLAATMTNILLVVPLGPLKMVSRMKKKIRFGGQDNLTVMVPTKLLIMNKGHSHLEQIGLNPD